MPSAPALSRGCDFSQTLSWAPLGKLRKGSPREAPGLRALHGLLSGAGTACRPYLSPCHRDTGDRTGGFQRGVSAYDVADCLESLSLG